jgi:anthranilate synthase component 1
VRDLLPLAAADPQRYPGLLASAAHGANARYDILFAFPQAALVLDRDGRVRDGDGVDRGASFLQALDESWSAQSAGSVAPSRAASAQDAVTRIGPAPAAPFRGGWLLFLGYELAGEIEPSVRLPLPPDDGLPLALALRCPAAIVVDHVAARTLLVAEAGHDDLLDALQADLERAAQFAVEPLHALAIDEDPAARFLAGVDAVHEHLRAGDVFQVNLSREWRVRLAAPPTPAAVLDALRRANPAPFAGLLQWRDAALVSSSPERLVSRHGGSVSTRPIAGTRARIAGDDEPARLRELIGHPKERAEHVMLIDLERNDLGRVCVPGSVVVDELMSLESYAHVHHIVSNVRGVLRPGVTPGAIVRAVFPGGTITGCPKVRTMQIIAALEGVGRGAYTGSLGYLDRDGDMDLNILIRTLALRGDIARLRAGAGIVADSVPERELDETRAKARGLLRALGSDA